MKRQSKAVREGEYSKVYEQMIGERREREREEKQREKWLERTLLNEKSWLKDPVEQKEI